MSKAAGQSRTTLEIKMIKVHSVLLFQISSNNKFKKDGYNRYRGSFTTYLYRINCNLFVFCPFHSANEFMNSVFCTDMKKERPIWQRALLP